LLDRAAIPDSLVVELDAPDQPPPFSIPTFEAVCQITNEALSNVVRHANASLLQIAVSPDGEEFRIVIADNGRGFDLKHPRRSGLGLRNIQQRALLHGGRVDIDTAPGAGTRLTIIIPMSGA
jgi:signal transduction histidine kinase